MSDPTLVNPAEREPNAEHCIEQVGPESEARFRTILDHSLDVAYRRDLDTDRYDYISPGIERLAGVTPQEISNWPSAELLEHIHPADRSAVDEVMRTTTEQPAQWAHVEYRFLHRDGRYRWFSENAGVIRNQENNEHYRIGTVRDVTERKQAEALNEALAEINTLIHSTLDTDEMMKRVIKQAATAVSAESAAISLRQADGWVVSYVYGFSPDIIGTRMNDEQEPHSMLAIQTRQAVAISDTLNDSRVKAEHMKEWNICSVMVVPLLTGAEVLGALYFNYHAQPIQFRQYHIDFANKLASSISLALENARLYNERVQAEKKLEEALAREQAAHAEAEAAVRLRDHFFNVAAHELRNPLTTMMGYSELLAQPNAFDNPERAERGVRTIHQQTIRLNKMIGALLDVSRIVEGQFTLDRAPFNLTPLVTRIVDEFKLTTHKHTLQITLPDEPLVLNGDEMRLEQVLRNLIGNAIKYTPQGGPIRIAVERCDSMACVSVADSGIGIPAEALPYLFTRFYRAPNAEAQHIPGLGIGLFVIHEIIAQHGGPIEVESTEEVGTTFRLHLPM